MNDFIYIMIFIIFYILNIVFISSGIFIYFVLKPRYLYNINNNSQKKIKYVIKKIKKGHKLYFRYGAMGASKTANALMVAFNYSNLGKDILLLKPSIDTRFGQNIIKSRCGLEREVDFLLEKDTVIREKIQSLNNIHCVIIDEAQFLQPNHIKELRNMTAEVPIICYGLKKDYKGNFFPGSEELLRQADVIEEIKTICVECCSRKATENAKFIIDKYGNKTIIKLGSATLDLGADEKYQPMCWHCWNKY